VHSGGDKIVIVGYTNDIGVGSIGPDEWILNLNLPDGRSV
jgi:hypothetical protein